MDNEHFDEPEFLHTTGILKDVVNNADNRPRSLRSAAKTDSTVRAINNLSCGTTPDLRAWKGKENSPAGNHQVSAQKGSAGNQESFEYQTIFPVAGPLNDYLSDTVVGRDNDEGFSGGQSSAYIEHLEAQIAALQVQVQSLTSPSITRQHSSKLRALTTESRILRQEVSEWENNFNERVKEEVDQRVKIEASLRGRVKNLEREVEGKDRKLAELQAELHYLRRAAGETEALYHENGTLAKRVEVLTELLAQSPVKTSFQPDLSPGFEVDGQRHKHRHTPMPPRLSPFHRPASSYPLTALECSDIAVTTGKSHESGAVHTEPTCHVDGQQQTGTDQGLRQEESASPGAGGKTRPLEEPLQRSPLRRSHSVKESHDASEPCFSPFRIPVDSAERPFQRQRRMRRFLSGSCGPRKLILPISSYAGSYPASAPPTLSPEKLGDESTPRAGGQAHARPYAYERRLSGTPVRRLQDSMIRLSLPEMPPNWETLQDLEHPPLDEGSLSWDGQINPESRDGIQLADFAEDSQIEALERPLLERGESLFHELNRSMERDDADDGNGADPDSPLGEPQMTDDEEPVTANEEDQTEEHEHLMTIRRWIGLVLPMGDNSLASRTLGRMWTSQRAPFPLARGLIAGGFRLCNTMRAVTAFIWRFVEAARRLATTRLEAGAAPRAFFAHVLSTRALPPCKTGASAEPSTLDRPAPAGAATPPPGSAALASSLSSVAAPFRRDLPHCPNCAGAPTARQFRCWLEHSIALALAIGSLVKSRSAQLCRV